MMKKVRSQIYTSDLLKIILDKEIEIFLLRKWAPTEIAYALVDLKLVNTVVIVAGKRDKKLLLSNLGKRLRKFLLDMEERRKNEK